WQSVANMIQITDEGVRPAFVRKSTRVEIDGEEVVVPGINAVLDAADFSGGILAAGSNPSSALNLMDGRLDTFWEPDMSDLLEDWWVQIDLGRAVSATRIVLKFVGEDLGDPFLQFKVTTSQGETIIGPRLFRTRFTTSKPIKNERVFEIDLISQLPTKWPNVRGDFTGDVIRYVGVGITDSDFGKARQVSQAEYESLSPAQQGEIEYFRRGASGRVRVLDEKEDWDALAGTDRQGPVVYYRRERPRLAEIELWSIGDNIGTGVLERGGRVTSWENNGAEAAVVDGDLYSTEKAIYWPAQGGFNPDLLLPSDPPDVERSLFVDLAGAFFLDNIRVLSASTRPPGPFRAYRIQLSDGSTNAGGSLAWKTVGSLDNIGSVESYHDFKFPLTKVEHFAFTYRLRERGGRHGLSEIQFFGEGYVPECRIFSIFEGTPAFIQVADTAQNLASIEWDADMPPGTDVILQTRTGDTVKRIIHYYKKNGEEYPGTAEEAAEAHATNKKFFGEASVGPVVAETIPGSDWSGWSQRYFNSGDKITSPSPRKFVAIQAT
ncbi:MAG: discoidin domain-containing protein, partial [Nitrospinota bacterium]